MDITLTRLPPSQIIAGDSIEFLVAIPGQMSAWAGSARLTGPAQMDATSCVTEGSDFRPYFQGAGGRNASRPMGTGDLCTGQYLLTVWATLDLDRKTVAQFPLTLLADLSTGTPAQTHARVMLPIIEAAIRARVTGTADGGIEGWQHEGVAVTKLPIDTLRALRKQYAAEVAALNNPESPIGRVKFAFTPAGGIPNFRGRFG